MTKKWTAMVKLLSRKSALKKGDGWGLLTMASKLKEVEAEEESSAEAENGAESEANTSTSAAARQTDVDEDPIYLKLWKKTKEHKDGNFDDEAEVKFNEFKRLHEKEIEEKGVDNLSIDEAYMKVLGHCSGYARGLGKGHPVVDKGGKKGKAEMEAELQQLRSDKNAMQAEIEFLKAESQRKEKEAQERGKNGKED